ncbi:MAG: Mut7-C RNAse domain-containing protein [Candidatus Dadabacteria bacterium]
MCNKFIADVHLGRLARALRMLGFDTLYRNDYTKTEVVELAASQRRTVLSKDPAFGKNSNPFIKIESDNWMDQLKQVLNACNLKNEIAPFTRCMVCNGMLVLVNKDEIAGKLEPNTRNYYHEFWQCENCSRIYWKGPHYNRMIKVIQQLDL